MELDVLKIWPDWKATKLLGEGSFGKVYEIVRNNFGIEEHCALKVITIPSSPAELQSMRNEGMDDTSATEYYKGLVEEFVQEIALMSKLKGNVNVVGYEDYAVIEHKDSIRWDIVIRMELLTALPTYIREHSFTANDTIKLGIDVCNALEVCHTEKIIHRDIKPDNIFVSQKGDFKLGDFGVARTIEKTVSGLSKKGTYTYMAPEVYKSEPYGTNVDVYSLGIVLYMLLNNNREPFLPPHPAIIKFSDKNDALVRRMNGEPIPPPANCNELLSRVVLKSVSFNSWERYQQPTQMKADLQTILNHISANSDPVLQMDHLTASCTYKTAQSQGSVPQANPTYATPPSNVPNAEVISVANDGNNERAVSTPPTPQQNQLQSQQSGAVAVKPGRAAKVLYILGSILGWIGAPLLTLLFLDIDTPMLIMSLLVTACMILLSVKKLAKYRKIFCIIMLVFSVLTFNIFTLIAGILFLCIKKTK
jgi:serine/threonine-protein kinase